MDDMDYAIHHHLQASSEVNIPPSPTDIHFITEEVRLFGRGWINTSVNFTSLHEQHQLYTSLSLPQWASVHRVLSFIVLYFYPQFSLRYSILHLHLAVSPFSLLPPLIILLDPIQMSEI
jgi:hypothetical protein